MKTVRLIAALMFAAAIPAFAQSAPPRDPAATPGVDQRQANQERRIQQGTQSGALTQKEADKLEKGQARVQTMEDKAKSDGVVTKQERQKLHHAQDTQSRKIHHQTHDRQHDYNHDGKKDHPKQRAH